MRRGLFSPIILQICKVSDERNCFFKVEIVDLLYHGFVRRYDLYLDEDSIQEAKAIFELNGGPLEGEII